ncbi:ATP-binding cassette domain-containing protein [Longispora sp. NPDC051575]|uniref:ATP-binding cassette domain-containing protein n=1 Tax=Longispora sp. NPDC051575 TaxID=3154943 RepID=UPI0034142815
MLTITNLHQGYGRNTVIEGLNLTMGRGLHALLGPNGAGKSTFLRTLATILPPRLGQIQLDGIELHRNSLEQIRRRIGYLPQQFGFDPAMTVSEFTCYAAWARGVPRPVRGAAVEEALDKVGLCDRRDEKMRKLSGGMVRRAGIAWAIVGNPSLILLDEPTVGLDPMQRINFRSIISQQRDAVIVLSTHLTDDVDAMADHVVVLDEGGVRFQGTPPELAEQADASSPGNTPLERGYTTLLADSQER